MPQVVEPKPLNPRTLARPSKTIRHTRGVLNGKDLPYPLTHLSFCAEERLHSGQKRDQLVVPLLLCWVLPITDQDGFLFEANVLPVQLGDFLLPHSAFYSDAYNRDDPVTARRL